MDFNTWKERFGHLHISAPIKEMLEELRLLEHKEKDKLKEELRARLEELREFESRVKAMLVAEWTLFLDILEGHHNGPMS